MINALFDHANNNDLFLNKIKAPLKIIKKNQKIVKVF